MPPKNDTWGTIGMISPFDFGQQPVPNALLDFVG